MNQNPEQMARDAIDCQLANAGWLVQDKARINLQASAGVAVREYQTAVGPADYVLFVDGKPAGIIEAKRAEEGVHFSVHESQVEAYAGARLKYLDNDSLPFVWLANGLITSFADLRDPKPRFREIFAFQRPETIRLWLGQPFSLRTSFLSLGPLPKSGLRECQVTAISGLEQSFRHNRQRALIQMATGAGKTFTAITAVYRLLKSTQARRILFLVDTKNLGEQAEQEFMAYQPADDNRRFTELYGVHRIRSRHIPPDCHVYISTIQRIYAVLKGQELDETEEETNPNECWQPRDVPQVVYNERLPPETFDCIIIDECHRSIYNLWMQVLDYFDAFQVGLTATPDARTFAYFRQNIVSEYSHETAVADGVNVGYDVFLIETKVTKQGGTLWKGEYVEHRERLSRRRRLELQDEDETYSASRLDRDIVNPDQIRTVIRTFRDHLPAMFPDRQDPEGNFETPKTLVFAKTDSHADDIIQIIRDEFGESSQFCRKITYRSEDDPKSVLNCFRNEYHPRIAVTVDMIATGTDVKPLECLLFMRDVRSRNYFEQMKGRGTRVLSLDDLRKVSPAARRVKDHFVIVDAIGVTQSLKTDSRPLEKKPGVPLRDLLGAVAAGARDEALFTSLAGRLARLDRQLTESERIEFAKKSGGLSLPVIAKNLLGAFDPDLLDEMQQHAARELPGAAAAEIEQRACDLAAGVQNDAARVFTGEFNEYIEAVRRLHEQKIDLSNPDQLVTAAWDGEQRTRAGETVAEFSGWIAAHRDEIMALAIFYDQPRRRRELTFAMVRELASRLVAERPALAPLAVWRAYEQLETVAGQPKNELVALVALVRRVSGIDVVLTPYDRTVDSNFKDWIFKKHAGSGNKFTKDQMAWLNMLKEHIANSIHVALDDLDYTPFDAHGGRGRMWQLFGDEMEGLLEELNEVLAG